MPYRSNEDLPMAVQAHLPPHAQDIYREAFNHAFASHAVMPPVKKRASHCMGGCQALVCEDWRQLGWTCCARLSPYRITADAFCRCRRKDPAWFTGATPMP